MYQFSLFMPHNILISQNYKSLTFISLWYFPFFHDFSSLFRRISIHFRKSAFRGVLNRRRCAGRARRWGRSWIWSKAICSPDKSIGIGSRSSTIPHGRFRILQSAWIWRERTEQKRCGNRKSAC